jgi:hypothetical protein
MAKYDFVNRHGQILSSKYYILFEEDSNNLPLIKTPCVLNHIDEIDPTYCTQEDAKVYDAGCPRCGADCIMSSCGPDGNYCVSYWMCHICSWRWETDRGITIQTQLELWGART